MWTPDLVPSVDVKTMKEDISFKMYDRVLGGYGLNPDPKIGQSLRLTTIYYVRFNA